MPGPRGKKLVTLKWTSHWTEWPYGVRDDLDPSLLAMATWAGA